MKDSLYSVECGIKILTIEIKHWTKLEIMLIIDSYISIMKIQDQCYQGTLL